MFKICFLVIYALIKVWNGWNHQNDWIFPCQLFLMSIFVTILYHSSKLQLIFLFFCFVFFFQTESERSNKQNLSRYPKRNVILTDSKQRWNECNEVVHAQREKYNLLLFEEKSNFLRYRRASYSYRYRNHLTFRGKSFFIVYSQIITLFIVTMYYIRGSPQFYLNWWWSFPNNWQLNHTKKILFELLTLRMDTSTGICFNPWKTFWKMVKVIYPFIMNN